MGQSKYEISVTKATKLAKHMPTNSFRWWQQVTRKEEYLSLKDCDNFTFYHLLEALKTFAYHVKNDEIFVVLL